METILSQLNAVPGVVGSMVCDPEGRPLARAFPGLFDESMLAGAAKVFADGAAGLETVTGKVGLVDLRFGDARVVVRPIAGAHLVLLCAAQMNLQLLNISASVAVPKLEKLVAARPPAPPAPAPAPQKAPPKAKPKREAPPDEDPGIFHW